MELDGIATALQALKYANAIEVIDEVLAFSSAATVADVREYATVKSRAAETRLEEEEARIVRAVCRHCEVEIVRGNDGAWYHGRIPSWGSRGCRSHSFERLGTWNNMLNERWTATPA